jgi:hypothetical protein
VPGFTATTSSPFSSANFHAAFSASVLEAAYQTYANSEIAGKIDGPHKLLPENYATLSLDHRIVLKLREQSKFEEKSRW